MSIMSLRPFCCLLLWALPSLAQPGQVSGYVNGPDRKGVPNAIVGFDRLDYKFHIEAKTDKRGFYQFQTLMNGDYSVTVMVDGKLRDGREFYHVSPGRQDLPLTFILKPAGSEPTEHAGAPPPDNSALTKTFEDGKAAFVAKQFEKAIEILKKAAEIDPKQAGVWSLLADSYLGVAQDKPDALAANYELARNAFARAIALTPGDAGIYNAWAVSLAGIQKVDEALQNLEKAIQLDSLGAGKYYYNFGVVHLSVGRNQAAMEAFKHATEADPNYAEAQYQYGLALGMSAKPGADGKLAPPPGAVEALQKYLQLAPAGPNAKTAQDILAMFAK